MCLKHEIGTSLVMRPDAQILMRLHELSQLEAVESQRWLKQQEKARRHDVKRHDEKSIEEYTHKSEKKTYMDSMESTGASRHLVMADMLLREHFRMNTVAACAPFRRYLEWRHLQTVNIITSSLELEKPLCRKEEKEELLDRLTAATAAVSGLLVDRLRCTNEKMVQAAIVEYVKTSQTSSSTNESEIKAAGVDSHSAGPSPFTKVNQPEPLRRVLSAFHGGLWNDLTISHSRKADSLTFMSDIANSEHFQSWFRVQAEYIGLLAIAEAVHVAALLRKEQT